jgi:hypothetical protein
MFYRPVSQRNTRWAEKTMLQLARMFREAAESHISNTGMPTNEAFLSGVEVIKAFQGPTGQRPQTMGWTAGGDVTFGWTVNAKALANNDASIETDVADDEDSEGRLQICIDRSGAITYFYNKEIVDASTFGEHVRKLPDS